MNQDEIIHYPSEFLNSLDLPPHILTLKIDLSIILFRNINPPRLCNRTRLTMKKMMNNIIEASILNGNFKEEYVLLPIISMIPTDLHFDFKRKQFSVLLTFAITSNKISSTIVTSLGTKFGKSLLLAFRHAHTSVTIQICSSTHQNEKQKILCILKHFNNIMNSLNI